MRCKKVCSYSSASKDNVEKALDEEEQKRKRRENGLRKKAELDAQKKAAIEARKVAKVAKRREREAFRAAMEQKELQERAARKITLNVDLRTKTHLCALKESREEAKEAAKFYAESNGNQKTSKEFDVAKAYEERQKGLWAVYRGGGAGPNWGIVIPGMPYIKSENASVETNAREAESVLTATVDTSSGEIIYLVKYKDAGFDELVASSDAKVKCPAAVIDFFERKLSLVEPNEES